MTKTIIKFFDNEHYDYPLIEIDEKDLKDFKRILKEYQKEDDYNFDDFIAWIKGQGIKIKVYSPDMEMFF